MQFSAKSKFLVVLTTSAVILCLFLYPFLHESGHLIAAFLFGGTIKGLTIEFFKANAYFTGVFTDFESSVIMLSGVGFPYLIWLIFILIVPKHTIISLEAIKFITSFMIICTLISWVTIPLLISNGRAPENDDVYRFIFYSGFNPSWVSISSGTLIVVSILVFVKKMDNILEIIK